MKDSRHRIHWALKGVRTAVFHSLCTHRVLGWLLTVHLLHEMPS